MAEYIAKRPLYVGGGQWVQPGGKIELTPAEAEKLSNSVKKAPPVKNKMETAPSNKAEKSAPKSKSA
jgi:hypothetical protein